MMTLDGLYSMIDEGRFGFLVDERMTGTHAFEEGCGPAGRHPMEFNVTWGARHVSEFLNPFADRFLVSDLNGTVTVGGLCENAPCKGRLELRYFSDATIRYTFAFKARGKSYRFVGEKVNIKPWNLAVSHTTCYGTLTEAKSGRLVSRSVTFFYLRTAPLFLASLRPA